MSRPDAVHPPQSESPGGRTLVCGHESSSQMVDAQLQWHLQPGVWAAPGTLDELLAVVGEVEHFQVHVIVQVVNMCNGFTNSCLDAVIQHPLKLLP